MEVLSLQRCVHHSGREAVARCPECGQFFCRECIVEHDDRVLCAECLKRLARRPGRGRDRFAALMRIGGCCAGLLIAWVFFYEAGRVLLMIPTSFHDGTLWRHDDDQ